MVKLAFDAKSLKNSLRLVCIYSGSRCCIYELLLQIIDRKYSGCWANSAKHIARDLPSCTYPMSIYNITFHNNSPYIISYVFYSLYTFVILLVENRFRCKTNIQHVYINKFEFCLLLKSSARDRWMELIARRIKSLHADLLDISDNIPSGHLLAAVVLVSLETRVCIWRGQVFVRCFTLLRRDASWFIQLLDAPVRVQYLTRSWSASERMKSCKILFKIIRGDISFRWNTRHISNKFSSLYID